MSTQLISSQFSLYSSCPQSTLIVFTVKFGPSVVYAVAVNCLYKDRVRVRDMDRVSGRVTDMVRFRV